jgi:PilX N-terminal
MRRDNQRGIALVLALLLTSVMSVLAVTLMFLSQTETRATMNYRMMTQARFAGEAGVQRAAAYLTDSVHTLAMSAVVPLLETSSSPVLYDGNPVVLKADADSSNFPLDAMKTGFAALAQGALTSGSTDMAYVTSAELLTLEKYDQYGGLPGYSATWKLTGVGSFPTSPNSSVTVTSIVEIPKIPANAWAAFATSDQCGALHFQGNTEIDSYDSNGFAMGPGGEPIGDNFGGNVGTFGNLELEGSATVDGNLSTSQTGVGSCADGAVVALSVAGSPDIGGEIVALPAQVDFPLPIIDANPNTPGTIDLVPTTAAALTTGDLANACALLGVPESPIPVAPAAPDFGIPAGMCREIPGVAGASARVIVTTPAAPVPPDTVQMPLNLPSITVGTNVEFEIVPTTGTSRVNANSIVTAGSGTVEIRAPGGETLTLGIQGLNADGTEMAAPLSLGTNSSPGWEQNFEDGDNYRAAALQILYAGSGTIKMYGNDESAAVIYAPEAAFELYGNAALYGSVLAKTILNTGNSGILFDRRLLFESFVMGLPLISNFNWERY